MLVIKVVTSSRNNISLIDYPMYVHMYACSMIVYKIVWKL